MSSFINFAKYVKIRCGQCGQGIVQYPCSNCGKL